MKFEGGAVPEVVSKNSAGNAAFDKLDRKTIGVKLEELPAAFNIPNRRINS